MNHQNFKLKYIPIEKVQVSKLNVRTIKTDRDLDELAESIKKIGIQQPIVVVKSGDIYEVIIGQRRFLAAKKAGLREIPAVIRKVKDDKEAIIASFSENIHRVDLDYQDKMNVATILLSQLGSVRKVAEQLGVSEATVKNYLGYAIVPNEIKAMVDNKEINATTAVRIARNIDDESKAIEIAKQVKETVRSEDKRKLISLAKENPQADGKELLSIFKKSKFERITIDLTPNLAEALGKAHKEYEIDRKEIVTEALSLWLSERGFLN